MWFPAHGEQAVSRDALVGHDAEELAWRHACVVHEPLKIATAGESLSQFPGIDRGYRKAQILGDLLERKAVLHPPVVERGRKTGADVALELRLFSHGKNQRAFRGAGLPWLGFRALQEWADE